MTAASGCGRPEPVVDGCRKNATEIEKSPELRMDWRAVFVVCALAAVAGMVLYLPFFIWFRVRARRSKSAGSNAVRYTAIGWCFLVLMLIALFGGFAVGQIAPTSWFGAQVRTLLGGIGFFYLICITFNAIEWCFRRLGIPFVPQLPSKHESALGSEDVPPA